MTSAAELAANAERRGATYWLLARLVLEPPAAVLLDELDRSLSSVSIELEEPLSKEVMQLQQAVVRARAGEPSETDLRAEHARLWGGLSKQYGPPPPYESVFREQRLPGEATTAVASAYVDAGLDPEVPEAGPADHIAVELRYLALCCVREAEAWRSKDPRDATRWSKRERDFLDRHVLAWVPAHCTMVAESSRTDYHRAIATLIACACVQDRQDFAEIAA